MKKMLIFVLSISLCLMGYAQEAANPQSEATSIELHIDPYSLPELPDSIAYRYPLFNGLSVSVNLFPPAIDIFGQDYRSYEAMVTLDLHHRFMPQIAAGIGNCDETTDSKLCYQTDMSPFFKVGMVYNPKYNELNAENFYGIILRYGYSHHTASIRNIIYNDGYWPTYGPTDLEDLSFNSHWLEIGGMIKVKFTKHLSMGWDAAFKPFLYKGGNKHGNPYFVPGYGSTNGMFGFGFHVYYDIK